jgi:hypothetical protein
MIRGSVDIITASEVHGWAYGAARREPVMVQAVLNHEILGAAMADIHRQDLVAAGFGDGRAGFVIKLFRPVDPLYLPFLRVTTDGGDTELPRAPMLGFAEFFTFLYAANPAIGRTRSVYGGLWTDRTDAAALLRGKCAIGQIPERAAPALAALIQDGFAPITLAADPPAWDGPLATQAAQLLADPALLAPLHAILEDHPLVLKADWVEPAGPLAQPSARNATPTPTECVEILVPFGEGAQLDVVRESHRMPEFTLHGGSRWRHEAVAAVGAENYLDVFELHPGTAVLMGPGTIFRIRPGEAQVARIACVPARDTPARLAAEGQERILETGVRVWTK